LGCHELVRIAGCACFVVTPRLALPQRAAAVRSGDIT
jgi:hypothetical protein